MSERLNPREEEYRAFREGLQPRELMENRSFIITLEVPQNFNKTPLLQDLSETLHLPILSRQMLGLNESTPEQNVIQSLRNYLSSQPPHGWVIDNLFNTKGEKKVVKDWSKENNLTIHSIDANLDKNRESITRGVFIELSKFCFEDRNLAAKYYEFRDICKRLSIPHVFIAGVCSYIYWGRRPLKDLDILVPTLDDLKTIGEEVGEKVEHLVSSYADTQYLNFSEGVEIVSDLVVIFKENGEEKRIVFPFEELMKDAMRVRFLGEECHVMSPEMLIIFKFSLGRFGIDKWGHHKDDYEDARGVIISQNIDFVKLEERARKLGAYDRVVLGGKILNISALSS